MSRYVAIEGVDGAGKSTVCEALAERLRGQGRTVLVVREPGGTKIGEQIRALVLEGDPMEPWTEALLFAAQRAQLAAEVVSPALARGEVVVSDRTLYSSLAYQGGGRGLGVEAVRIVNETGLAGVLPELVVVLWLDPAAALDRQEVVDRIGGEGPGFQVRTAAAYRDMADSDPERVRLLAADRPLDEIVDEIVGLMT